MISQEEYDLIVSTIQKAQEVDDVDKFLHHAELDKFQGGRALPEEVSADPDLVITDLSTGKKVHVASVDDQMPVQRYDSFENLYVKDQDTGRKMFLDEIEVEQFDTFYDTQKKLGARAGAAELRRQAKKLRDTAPADLQLKLFDALTDLNAALQTPRGQEALKAESAFFGGSLMKTRMAMVMSVQVKLKRIWERQPPSPRRRGRTLSNAGAPETEELMSLVEFVDVLQFMGFDATLQTAQEVVAEWGGADRAGRIHFVNFLVWCNLDDWFDKKRTPTETNAVGKSVHNENGNQTESSVNEVSEDRANANHDLVTIAGQVALESNTSSAADMANSEEEISQFDPELDLAGDDLDAQAQQLEDKIDTYELLKQQHDELSIAVAAAKASLNDGEEVPSDILAAEEVAAKLRSQMLVIDKELALLSKTDDLALVALGVQHLDSAIEASDPSVKEEPAGMDVEVEIEIEIEKGDVVPNEQLTRSEDDGNIEFANTSAPVDNAAQCTTLLVNEIVGDMMEVVAPSSTQTRQEYASSDCITEVGANNVDSHKPVEGCILSTEATANVLTESDAIEDAVRQNHSAVMLHLLNYHAVANQCTQQPEVNQLARPADEDSEAVLEDDSTTDSIESIVRQNHSAVMVHLLNYHAVASQPVQEPQSIERATERVVEDESTLGSGNGSIGIEDIVRRNHSAVMVHLLNYHAVASESVQEPDLHSNQVALAEDDAELVDSVEEDVKQKHQAVMMHLLQRHAAATEVSRVNMLMHQLNTGGCTSVDVECDDEQGTFNSCSSVSTSGTGSSSYDASLSENCLSEDLNVVASSDDTKKIEYPEQEFGAAGWIATVAKATSPPSIPGVEHKSRLTLEGLAIIMDKPEAFGVVPELEIQDLEAPVPENLQHEGAAPAKTPRQSRSVSPPVFGEVASGSNGWWGKTDAVVATEQQDVQMQTMTAAPMQMIDTSELEPMTVARVVHDYQPDADAPTELSVLGGEVVAVFHVEEVDDFGQGDAWCFAMNELGDEGWVRHSMLHEVTDHDIAHAEQHLDYEADAVLLHEE